MTAHEEKHVIGALTNLCRDQKVTHIAQIGAGDGYEAYCVMQAIGCSVTCVEGDTRQNTFSPEMAFHYSLIDATDCMMPFYLHQSTDLSTQISRGSTVDQELVHMRQRRGDTFCRYHGIKPDALIIDTEGTTLDVLEGFGDMLNDVKIIYAECQTQAFREGMRLVGDIDEFLSPMGFTQHKADPSYDGGAQGNYTWVRT